MVQYKCRNTDLEPKTKSSEKALSASVGALKASTESKPASPQPESSESFWMPWENLEKEEKMKELQMSESRCRAPGEDKLLDQYEDILEEDYEVDKDDNPWNQSQDFLEEDYEVDKVDDSPWNQSQDFLEEDYEVDEDDNPWNQSQDFLEEEDCELIDKDKYDEPWNQSEDFLEEEDCELIDDEPWNQSEDFLEEDSDYDLDEDDKPWNQYEGARDLSVKEEDHPLQPHDHGQKPVDEHDNEEVIKRTLEVLERHRPPVSYYRSAKRGIRSAPRRPWREEPPFPSRKKTRRGGRRRCRHKSWDARELTLVDVDELRYSQVSCKETFCCGRPVLQLTEDLMKKKVSLSASFLQLTAYEATDEETNAPIIKCIDNRRLHALKEFANRTGKRVMINVRLFSKDSLREANRIMNNSDDTNGLQVRLRKDKNRNNKRHQPFD